MRDESLPHAHRVRALASCIQFSLPIGFNATWAHLEAKTGMRRQQLDFLAPAIDLLEKERFWRYEAEKRYAAVRRQQKRAGRRSPLRDEVTPQRPQRWHGDERAGAIQDLTFWLKVRRSPQLESHEHGAAAIHAAQAAVAGDLAILDRESLQRTLDWARREAHIVGKDPLAWVTLSLLSQIFIVLLHGSPAVGVPWNFVAAADESSRRAAVVRTRLTTPVGLWRSTPQDRVADLSAAAADLLVLGYDSPALRELAGLSAGDLFYEVEPVLATALEQLGASDLLSGSANRAGLAARLELFLDRDMSLRELSTWAHQVIGHEGEDDLQPFVLLDDIYDDWEYSGQDLPYLDLVARKAARDFLAGRPVNRLDWLEPPTVAVASDGHNPRPRRAWRDRLRLRRSQNG